MVEASPEKIEKELSDGSDKGQSPGLGEEV